MTLGEALIGLLEARGVDTVFGIPGVHTVELYRGLAGSGIRHVTPRHEADAGFMADGYFRASGKPGVCFLITGPGVTNAITPMAQARADGIPMLIISGVNPVESHGREDGLLHELPDQAATLASVATLSLMVRRPEDLERVIKRAFHAMLSERPGPVHIDIPIDVMSLPAAPAAPTSGTEPAALHPLAPHPEDLERAAATLNTAESVVILAGGGARAAGAVLQRVAERLDAPVISTVNGRGLMAGHPLDVPASPSLPSVRALLAGADAVLALGTQFGPTDYDMYRDLGFPDLKRLIRVDTSPAQLSRGVVSGEGIVSDA
ncbi:MAG: thiamine pyrophosphate-binding protein, partial [Pseudomonadota bacterium]